MIGIAVTQRVAPQRDRGERWDALDQRLEQWLLQSALAPLPVPNALGAEGEGCHERVEHWLSVCRPGAMVLSGGNDLGESPERDRVEVALLEIARERRLPVLGICRGMQMMAVWAGAALEAVEGHVARRHTVEGAIAREVNSYHQFGISTCPPGFEVLARSDDGCIEAIAHVEFPWEAWMWHPEREDRFVQEDLRRIADLVDA